MNDGLDRATRKQLALARIAADRLQFQQDLAALGRAAHPRQIGVDLVRAALGPGWLSDLVGGGGLRAGVSATEGPMARVLQIMLLLRRHPLLVSLIGSSLPWLKRRRGFRRLVLLATVGVGAAAVTWLVSSRRPAAR